MFDFFLHNWKAVNFSSTNRKIDNSPKIHYGFNQRGHLTINCVFGSILLGEQSDLHINLTAIVTFNCLSEKKKR